MTEPIIFYGSSSCPMVPPVRQTLHRSGAPFEYINITFNALARREVMQINGGNASVPTLVFPDGSTLTEPSDQDLRRKLGALGYEVGPASPLESVLTALQSPMVRMFAAVFVAVGLTGRDPRLWVFGALVLLASYLAQVLSRRL